MGNTSSSSSSNTSTKIVLQIPVEESLLTPNQGNHSSSSTTSTTTSSNSNNTTNSSSSTTTTRTASHYYSLRDTIDPIINENTSNSTTTSSVLKSKYGYTIDTGLRHVVVLNPNDTTTTTTTKGNHVIQQQQPHFFQSTSGRMMKTFPLRRTFTSTTSANSNTSNSNNNNNNNNNSHHPFIASTAVVKVTWLLEQSQTMDANTSSSSSSSSSSYHTTTWLEEHVQELQRIRTLTKDLTFVAPFVDWGYVQYHPNPNHNNTIPSPPQPPIPKPTLQTIMMAPHNQKYYIPHRTSSSSTGTSTTVTGNNSKGHGTGSNAIAPIPLLSLPLVSSSSTSSTTSGQPVTTTMRAVYLLRSSVYTTLADRLCCRPFLTLIEKLYITHQLLVAIHTLHTRNIVHGSLTTENIGLTSTNYVILLDLSSPYKARTALPDNDPSEYVYYFQSHSNHYRNTSSTTNNSSSHTNSSHNSEKRCYLAPERFYTPSSTAILTKNETTSPTAAMNQQKESPLTPQMDIFSLGCVLTELFCNGERCFDLGDIMEYRRLNQKQHDDAASSMLPNTIVQKLNKIDNSTIRAACKHMMQLHPSQRCSTVQEYYDRLFFVPEQQHPTTNTTNTFPTIPFQIYTDLLQQMMTGTMEIHKLLSMLSDRDENINSSDDTEDGMTSSVTPKTIQHTGSVTIITPDARILLLALAYSNVLYETMGIRDTVQSKYIEMMVGPTLVQPKSTLPPSYTTTTPTSVRTTPYIDEENKIEDDHSLIGSDAYTQKLFASVEALLNDLDSNTNNNSINVDDETTLLNIVAPMEDCRKLMSLHTNPSMDPQQFLLQNTNDPSTVEDESLSIPRTDLYKSSLLIYVQIILSTIRNVQRPVTKMVALQLIHRLIYYVSDDIRLQRIVPVTVSLLHDSDPLVRAKAVQVITTTVSVITTFPPSDSKIFPQYIFKRVAHMITDPAIIVRVTFARCIATLAETSQRFLDVTHTVRLYELVGNETASRSSGVVSRDEMQPPNSRGSDVEDKDTVTTTATIFGDDVTKLLDANSRVSSGISLAANPYDSNNDPSNVTNTDNISVPVAGRTLIVNTYSAELTSLQETISRWVVHIATDQSEHCSLPKRAMISDLSRLCAFFGMDGVTSFILPQILSFLNERKDWQLRAALFEHIPSVCQCIGRAATEEFVLPCIEIGLVDSEERVICSALMCLSRIARTGLLSRLAIIGSAENSDPKDGVCLIKKYAPLLLFPSESIRHHAMNAFISIFRWIGPPDCEAFIFPMLRPYFRCRLTSQTQFNEDYFKSLLKPAWTRETIVNILETIKSSERDRAWTPGAWTSIGVTVNDGKKENNFAMASEVQSKRLPQDPEECNMKAYLKILARHLTQSSIQDRSLTEKSSMGLTNGMEGYGKLAQSVMFAKQNVRLSKDTIPDWYLKLRDTVENSNGSVSESVSIRSVSTLGKVYGLSIMGIEGILENDYSNSEGICSSETIAQNVLHSFEAENIEGVYRGEWGAESVQEPEITDTTLLVAKLKALDVPPLPLDLGNAILWPRVRGASVKDINVSPDWKPRSRSLLATSSTLNGHTAPVSRLAMSMDQTFLASSSFDGTCRVWESQQMIECGGLLESSVLYKEHSRNGAVRINDIAMVEGTHSIVSGASDGSVHVWRVDMVSAADHVIQPGAPIKHSRSRTVGSTNMRTVDMQEGEVLAVSHFNSPSGSIVTFGTQLGVIHSWDLRCANEPFNLQYSPELGYMTSLALGSDRNWIVSGTSRGYVSLWDIRFQQCVKLWRHNRCTPISRLATSTVPMPENWGANVSTSNVRPFLFVAAGANECSMFDMLSSTCTRCFRTVAGDTRNLNSCVDDPPELVDVPFTSKGPSGVVRANSVQNDTDYVPILATINCMVGSIGTNSNSYLITGGSDCSVRFWDFATPSKCFVLNGLSQSPSRPSYERIDFEGQRRLMLCRQSQQLGFRDEAKLPRKTYLGLTKPDQNHSDSILDIKLLDNNGIVSCSRDCTIKVWR